MYEIGVYNLQLLQSIQIFILNGHLNQSTKDNVGTLPLFAYTTPDQPPRPLDFSTTDDLTARETVVTEIEQEAVRGAILFEANSVVVVKGDHICGYPTIACVAGI